MTRNKIVILFLILSFFYNSLLKANISIIATVDNEIITNYDLIKEINYLEILNPNLADLGNNQKLEIAKNSLINEIIKKKEIKKFLKVEKKDNQFTEDYLKNLYSKLGIKNEEEFENKLKDKNIYNLSKIKDKINIELFWNELIYLRYKDQVKVDKESLISKVESLENQNRKEFFLSEIIFMKKKNVNLNDYIKEIRLSINEIGFNNTANIYSASASSKLGGKLGWVRDNSLSKSVSKELNKLNVGEYTDIIKLGNNFLILKIEDIRLSEIKIDKEKEIEKLIKIETNKQLNKF